jgi:L-threonylcarbamoyladenylate synthase
MPEIAPGQSLAAIGQAVALLRDGQLIGLPTETVYGLAADADNPVAVANIFAAKGRPADHPLIVHVGADDLLSHYAREIPDAAWLLAEAFWPGPLTMILKKSPGVCDAVTGGQDTVGVRMPGHPVALALLRAFAEAQRIAGQGGGGLAAPSANRFGRISPTSARHVADEIGTAVSLILDGGDCQVGIESTIVDLSRGSPVILRPGAITAEQLSLVLGEAVSVPSIEKSDTPRVSGSMASHYAPLTPVRVLDMPDMSQALLAASDVAAIVRDGPDIDIVIKQHPNVVVLPDDPVGFAQGFYRALRALDARGCRQILVQSLPTSSRWAALRDRLGRAAHAGFPDND